MSIKQYHAMAAMLCFCMPILGCGSGEGSSQGMAWNIVLFGLRDGAKPEQVRAATEQISEIPSQLSEVERYEWGELITNPRPQLHSHCLLVTVKDIKDSPKVLSEQLSDSFLAGFQAEPLIFDNLRDATPGARGSTHGHLRRLLYFRIQKGDSEKVQKVEKTLRDLPSKVPAVERLQWGVAPNDKNSETSERWGVLFTFEGTDARDACVSDPAYKEFEKLADNPAAFEYIADDTWSF